MFEFFMNSALISEDQLGFTSGDSCVNQIEIIRFSCSGSQDSLSWYLQGFQKSLTIFSSPNNVSGSLFRLPKDILTKLKQRANLTAKTLHRHMLKQYSSF